MAESIGLASGLLTLASFAFQSGVTLYNTIQSFKSHLSRVHDLTAELESLNGVLGILAETVSATTEIDLSALELPLWRCGNACKDFQDEILKCSARSSASRASFRDWAKLRYMNEDMDGFRRLLAGYKLTINIALTDANLRKSSVTAESLKGYKDLIQTTTSNLQDHLQNVNDKLDAILGKSVKESNADATELRLIEERLSTEKCLQICAQLSQHIDQIQKMSNINSDLPELDDPDIVPERVTNEALKECKNSLTATAAKLETHMKLVMDRIVSKSKTAMSSEEDIADIIRLREEWDTTRQCMDICSKAEGHLSEKTSTIDNYATGDSVQIMVSTNGKTIHGRNRGFGWRTRQIGGHLSDASLQQLSRDMNGINFTNFADDGSLRSNSSSVLDAGETQPTSEFQGRYGRGFKLASEKPANVNITVSSDGRARQSPQP